MRVLCCVTGLMAAAGLAGAMQAAGEDRAGVERLVRELNDAFRHGDARSIARLFTATSEFRTTMGRQIKGRSAIERAFASAPPWSETTPPRIEIGNIVFPAAGLALVDASATEYGSVILKRVTPLLLVLAREGGEWRILRYLPAAGVPPGCGVNIL